MRLCFCFTTPQIDSLNPLNLGELRRLAQSTRSLGEAQPLTLSTGFDKSGITSLAEAFRLHGATVLSNCRSCHRLSWIAQQNTQSHGVSLVADIPSWLTTFLYLANPTTGTKVTRQALNRRRRFLLCPCLCLALTCVRVCVSPMSLHNRSFFRFVRLLIGSSPDSSSL